MLDDLVYVFFATIGAVASIMVAISLFEGKS